MAFLTCTGSFESNQELSANNYPAGEKICGGKILIRRRINYSGWARLDFRIEKNHSAENQLLAPNTILIFWQKLTPPSYIGVKTLIASRRLMPILMHEGLQPLGCLASLYITKTLFFRNIPTVPKTVAQCWKYPISYLNTLSWTIPCLRTLSRAIPHLNILSRSIPYLNTMSGTFLGPGHDSAAIAYLSTWRVPSPPPCD